MPQESESLRKLRQLLQSKYGFEDKNIRSESVTYIDGEIGPDILVYGKKDSIYVPILVAEIKKDIKPIHEDQLFAYMNQLDARYGVLYDGNNLGFYYRTGKGTFAEIPDLPFEGKGEIPFDRSLLKVSTNLPIRLSEIIHIISKDFIRSYRRMQVPDSSKVISELQKIILCKLVDEQSLDQNLLFYSYPVKDGLNSLKARIDQLFENVKSKFVNLYDPSENISLQDKTLNKVVTKLQSYSLIFSNREHLIESYWHAVKTAIEEENLTGMYGTGLFIDPRPLTEIVVALIRPSISHKVLEPYTSTGLFLVSCLAYIRNKNQDVNAITDYSTYMLHGFSYDRYTARNAKFNMIIHGGNYENITVMDRNFHQTLKKLERFGGFDLVLNHSLLYHKKEQEIIERKLDFVPRRRYDDRFSSYYFVEAGLKFLKRGGQLAIMLPTSFLFSREVLKLRNYLIDNQFLKAVISLPFTKDHLVILEKTPKRHVKSLYRIFMADCSHNLMADHNSNLNSLLANYHDFSKKGTIKESDKPPIFLVNPSNLRNTSWVVEYQFSLLKQRRLKVTESKLSDLVEMIPGIRNPTSKHIENGKNRIPYIRVSDIINSRITYENIRSLDTDSVRKSDVRVRTSDVLFSIRGTVGKSALVQSSEFLDAVISSQLAILRVRDKKLNPYYLHFILLSRYVQNQIEISKRKGPFSESLSLNDLKGIRIPFPTLITQQRIVKRIWDYIEQNRADFNIGTQVMPEIIDSVLEEYIS